MISVLMTTARERRRDVIVLSQSRADGGDQYMSLAHAEKIRLEKKRIEKKDRG